MDMPTKRTLLFACSVFCFFSLTANPSSRDVATSVPRFDPARAAPPSYPPPPSYHSSYLCFVSVHMAANGDFLEAVQNIGALGIRLPEERYRYIVLTNDASLNTEDWEKAVVELNRTKYRRVKTHVTYAKFAGYLSNEKNQAMADALASCRVVFIMDGVYVPVPDETVWEDLEQRVKQSRGGLLAQLKPYNKTIAELLASLPGNQKDTQENVDKTLAWLQSQPSYRQDMVSHWTNFFGYDPTNEYFQRAVADFWNFYHTELLTPRDQPLWSWIVETHGLEPSLVKCVDPKPTELSPYVQIFWEQQRAQTSQKTPRPQPTLENWNFDKVKVFRRDPAHKYTGLKTFEVV